MEDTAVVEDCDGQSLLYVYEVLNLPQIQFSSSESSNTRRRRHLCPCFSNALPLHLPQLPQPESPRRRDSKMHQENDTRRRTTREEGVNSVGDGGCRRSSMKVKTNQAAESQIIRAGEISDS